MNNAAASRFSASQAPARHGRPRRGGTVSRQKIEPQRGDRGQAWHSQPRIATAAPERSPAGAAAGTG
jgi:hypothetical protein